MYIFFKVLILTLVLSSFSSSFANDVADIQVGTSIYEDLLKYRSGFGRQVTGGAGGEVVVIESLDFQALKTALTGNAPKWIRFAPGLTGEIEIEGSLYIGSNKTIDGRGADITLTSPDDCDGIQFWGMDENWKKQTNRRNLIVHNIKIIRVGTGDNCGQGLGIAFDAKDVWVDHVTFSRNGDESLSVGKGSTNVTVSWCKFVDTVKGILLSWSDGDNPAKERAMDENMKVTVHHSYFKNVAGRTPVLSYGKAHFYNNLFQDWGWSAAGIFEWAEYYSEKNIYAGTRRNQSTPAINTYHVPRYTLADGYVRSAEDVFLDTDSSLHIKSADVNASHVFSPKTYYGYIAETPDYHLQHRLTQFAGWSKDPQWPKFVSPEIIERKISSSADDAQESINSAGQVNIAEQSLSMSLHPKGTQMLGLRFNSVDITPESVITQAWVQFTASESSSLATRINIVGEKNANAMSFTETDQNISTRGKTTANILWQVAPWKHKNESDVAQKTADISPLIQEIIHQKDWESGHSLVLTMTGNGLRKAYAWDAEPAKAAVLHVEYSADGDHDGVVDIVDNCPTLANHAQLDTDKDDAGNLCDADDDNDGKEDSQDNCPLMINTGQVDTDGDGQGNVCDNDDDNDQILDVDDNCPVHANPEQHDQNNNGKGDLCSLKQAGGMVTQTLVRQIETNSDDAEEYGEGASGRVVTGGSTLDMVDHRTGQQTIGLRFTRVHIPKNTKISKAWLQFTAKKAAALSTRLLIQAEKNINAKAFATRKNNITARLKNPTSVTWKPAAWEKSQASQAQQTPDIAALIQEIVNQDEWVSGNAIVLLITGEGYRAAYTKESDPDKAATLHIDYLSTADKGKDSDADGIEDVADNCPYHPNTNQLDTDQDHIGNTCDNDDDADKTPDIIDNCPLTFNFNQLDSDADGQGDVCDNNRK